MTSTLTLKRKLNVSTTSLGANEAPTLSKFQTTENVATIWKKSSDEETFLKVILLVSLFSIAICLLIFIFVNFPPFTL